MDELRVRHGCPSAQPERRSMASEVMIQILTTTLVLISLPRGFIISEVSRGNQK
jgi:hypothetical protein